MQNMGDPQGAWPEKVAIICTLIIVCSGSVATMSGQTWCMHNTDSCPHCPPERKQCNATEDGKPQHCYALWRNTSTTGVEWVHRGCWLQTNQCDSKTCDGQLRDNSADPVIFCCCSGDDCNADVSYTPQLTTPMPEKNDTPIHFHPQRQVFTVLMSLVPITGIALIIVVTFWLWRRHKVAYHEPLPTQEPALLSSPPSPLVGLKPIQLKEVRARGRFGKVWLATMMTDSVAVKEFPIQELRSWETERDIYMLGQMNSHENILHFIGAEKRGDIVSTQLWLITEFHERGSLYDYLKGNLITWIELLRIAESMAAGLAFLHEEVPASKVGDCKPPVAHRDFKSKNVLLKLDLTACIADFGLAIKFEPGIKPSDTHGQVGTRRYMAPEVLEGAINFNLDSFLRIDMYACGLVLWELLQRCSAADGPVDEYRLPFEAEVGQHPTLEEMQDVVIHQKKRPVFKDTWGKHLGMRSLYDTIEECWDQDAEARLSSCCIHERLMSLTRDSSLATSPLAPTSVVIAPRVNPPRTELVALPPVDEADAPHSSSPPAYSESPLSVGV